MRPRIESAALSLPGLRDARKFGIPQGLLDLEGPAVAVTVHITRERAYSAGKFQE